MQWCETKEFSVAVVIRGLVDRFLASRQRFAWPAGVAVPMVTRSLAGTDVRGGQVGGVGGLVLLPAGSGAGSGAARGGSG